MQLELLLVWMLNALALIAVANFVPGIHVEGFGAALIAAFFLGLVNTLIRPLLLLLTLPVTVITLGLFIFVINGLLFWTVGSVLRGFIVDSFCTAYWARCCTVSFPGRCLQQLPN